MSNNYRQSIFINIDGNEKFTISCNYEHGEKIFKLSCNSRDTLLSNDFPDIIKFINPKIINLKNVNIFLNSLLLDEKILIDSDNVLVI